MLWFWSPQKTILKRRKVDHEKLFEEYNRCGTYLGTARKFGISDTAVKKIVKNFVPGQGIEPCGSSL